MEIGKYVLRQSYSSFQIVSETAEFYERYDEKTFWFTLWDTCRLGLTHTERYTTILNVMHIFYSTEIIFVAVVKFCRSLQFRRYL